MDKKIIKNKIENIYNKISTLKSEEWNLNVNQWDWSSGVILYGLLNTYKVLCDEKYKKFLEDWFKINTSLRIVGSVNNCAPLNAALYLATENNEKLMSNICLEYSYWCRKVALKTSDNGWSHVWKGGDPDYENQVWADSLFMAGIFLLNYGIIFNDKFSFNEAIEQFDIHLKSLYDDKESLFYHGYHCLTRKPLGQFWARGNGWVVVSVIELIYGLQQMNMDCDKYVDMFKKVMEKAYSLTSPEGMLRTIITNKNAYLETTGTALFGFAAIKGYQLGVLDERFLVWARKIVESILGYINTDGYIAFCSYGTNPETEEVYLTRPVAQSIYADGIVLMLLSQALTVESK